VPRESSRRVVRTLADRGYNAEPEAVTLIENAPEPRIALARTLEALDGDALKVTAEAVREVLDDGPVPDPPGVDDADRRTGSSSTDATGETTVESGEDARSPASEGSNASSPVEGHPSVSTGDGAPNPADDGGRSPVETKGSAAGAADSAGAAAVGRDPSPPEVSGDVTGRSTGTGEYADFVATFQDRYERLSRQLVGRVDHRPTDAVAAMPAGSDAALIGMVNDVRSTASGHWLVELEDENGVFPCLVMKDRPIADLVNELLFDEVIAIEGTLSDDGGVLFADSVHFPDVPRTYTPSTADRSVKAALISDVHVGSQEFRGDAWSRFADWLHTSEAGDVEYLLVAGDMVEGVGVYPEQDEELDVVDIYDQYETFSERLKEIPGDLEVVMIPGNHDAVRLAEPQPAFDEELRGIMSAHDARIVANPSTVTVEGVSVLLYHGVSLDGVIAELPDEKASYEEPQHAMYQLLKKRHVAPQFGGSHTRIAPEERDYLVVDEVPDVFHTGHVHKLGYGKYHGVLAVNSGCWQEQTAFQRSMNIDPDWGYAPILDLETLGLTIRDFSGA